MIMPFLLKTFKLASMVLEFCRLIPQKFSIVSDYSFRKTFKFKVLHPPCPSKLQF